MRERRLFELSAMNILFCLLVIFIHVTSEPVTGYLKTSFPYAVVCITQRGASFVVQGFIFLSGLKLMKSKNRSVSYPAFCRDRFRRILLPYLLWVLIYYAYFIGIGWLRFDMGELVRYIYVGNLVSPFYFVIIITQFYLLTPVWRFLTDKCHPLPLCLGALILMLLSMRYLPRGLSALGLENFRYYDRIFPTYLLYWVAGCVAGKHYDRLHSWAIRHTRMLVIDWLLAFCIAVLPYWYASACGHSVPWLNELHILYCICAIMGVYGLCVRLPVPSGKPAAFLKTLDHATYLIFLVHCLPIQEVNRQLTLHGITSLTVRYCIRIVAVYLLSIGGCMLWQKVKTTVLEAFKKQKVSA